MHLIKTLDERSIEMDFDGDIPRVGDLMEIQGNEYKVKLVKWQLNRITKSVGRNPMSGTSRSIKYNQSQAVVMVSRVYRYQTSDDAKV